LKKNQVIRCHALGLNVERMKKQKALNRNMNLTDSEAYCKVFRIDRTEQSGLDAGKTGLSDIVN